MPLDPSLEDILRGNKLTKDKVGQSASKEDEKNQFEKAIDKNIQEILDLKNFDEFPNQNILISPEGKRKQAEHELLNQVKNTEFKELTLAALEILIGEGKQYLEIDEYEKMIENLKATMDNLNNLDLTKALNQEIEELVEISPATHQAIFKIAVKKFAEEHFSASLALFTLLAILNSEDEDYWLRSGICAQQCEKYDLAIKMYRKASNLNPELIAARLFEIQCHLELNQKGEAETAYNSVKMINEKTPIDGEWLEIYSYLGSQIQRK